MMDNVSEVVYGLPSGCDSDVESFSRNTSLCVTLSQNECRRRVRVVCMAGCDYNGS